MTATPTMPIRFPRFVPATSEPPGRRRWRQAVAALAALLLLLLGFLSIVAVLTLGNDWPAPSDATNPWAPASAPPSSRAEQARPSAALRDGPGALASTSTQPESSSPSPAIEQTLPTTDREPSPGMVEIGELLGLRSALLRFAYTANDGGLPARPEWMDSAVWEAHAPTVLGGGSSRPLRERLEIDGASAVRALLLDRLRETLAGLAPAEGIVRGLVTVALAHVADYTDSAFVEAVADRIAAFRAADEVVVDAPAPIDFARSLYSAVEWVRLDAISEAPPRLDAVGWTAGAEDVRSVVHLLRALGAPELIGEIVYKTELRRRATPGIVECVREEHRRRHAEPLRELYSDAFLQWPGGSGKAVLLAAIEAALRRMGEPMPDIGAAITERLTPPAGEPYLVRIEILGAITSVGLWAKGSDFQSVSELFEAALGLLPKNHEQARVCLAEAIGRGATAGYLQSQRAHGGPGPREADASSVGLEMLSEFVALYDHSDTIGQLFAIGAIQRVATWFDTTDVLVAVAEFFKRAYPGPRADASPTAVSNLLGVLLAEAFNAIGMPTASELVAHIAADEWEAGVFRRVVACVAGATQASYARTDTAKALLAAFVREVLYGVNTAAIGPAIGFVCAIAVVSGDRGLADHLEGYLSDHPDDPDARQYVPRTIEQLRGE